MKRKTFSCGLEATLSIIGGRWKFLIIWHLARRTFRFGELKRVVAGVTEKMLIQGLKELESDGIVHRRDFRKVPPRVEYSLTPRGQELAHVLRPMCEWGEQNFKARIAPPPEWAAATEAVQQLSIAG
jgi:DNA-binding HxlR family transcriptional regulator